MTKQDHPDPMGVTLIRTYVLDDRDGALDQSFYVTVMVDPYTGAEIRVVYAWANPVIKIEKYGDDITWWWCSFDLGPETSQSRHREVVVNFLIDTGMVTGEDVDEQYDKFTEHLAGPHEEVAFNHFAECIGEHEPDQYVDRIIALTPFEDEA